MFTLGKTYTMGLLNKIDEDSKGLVPLSLRHLMTRLREPIENNQMYFYIFFCEKNIIRILLYKNP